MELNKLKVSFSVKKKEEVKQLDSKVIGESISSEKKDQTDFILSVEENKVNSILPKAEPRELVIPLIKQNRWQVSQTGEDHNDSQKKRPAEPSGEPQVDRKKKRMGSPSQKAIGDALDDEAVKEIMEDVSRYNEEWDTRGIEDVNLTIPLLMQNQVPEGYETDDRLDVSIRPEQASEADYEEVPIEQFGMAMLRGMGWNEKEGIGSKMKANVVPVEVTVRPKGQGLGADRRPGDELKQKKKAKRKPGDKALQEEEDPGGFTKGAPILVLSGPHKNLYGQIEGVDEDNSRVVIKFALGSQLATLSQFAVQRVTKEEYKKYSKDLGKFSKGHEELKKRGDDKARNGSDSEGREKSRQRDRDDRTSRTGDRHSRPDREDRKPHRHARMETDEDRSDDQRRDGYDGDRQREVSDERQRDRHKHSRKDKHRDRDGYTGKSERDDDKRHKRKEEEDHRHRHGNRREEQDEHRFKSSDKQSSSSSATHWLRPDLRVRFIDASYKKGKYYNAKVKVVDVVTRDTCTCQTDEGRYLEDIHQSMLETLIPKTDPGYVMVVSGKLKGHLGVVLKRDKKSCQADVQLLRERDRIARLDYDGICEYAGNIHDEDDY